MSTELALFAHAKEALAAAVRIDEVLDVRDAAERAKLYARQAKDRQLQADAAALIVRAERRLGEILVAIKADGQMSAGGRPSTSNITEPETGSDDAPVFDQTSFTLADLGISKHLSSRAQQLAALDEGIFEEELEAKREKILSTDAPVIGPKVIKARPAPKPAPIKPLEPRRWHQFAYSVLALTMASDRVSSEAVLKLGEFCGVLECDGDTVDFTPEAIEALGSLAEAALKALDGGDQNTAEGSGTAREALGGQPLPERNATGSSPGHSQGDIGDLQHGTQSAPHHNHTLELREAYEGEIALLGDSRGRLTMVLAANAMRAGYAAEVPVAQMAQDLGHPLGTVKTWANRLELTSIARMHASQHRFEAAS